MTTANGGSGAVRPCDRVRSAGGRMRTGEAA